MKDIKIIHPCHFYGRRIGRTLSSGQRAYLKDFLEKVCFPGVIASSGLGSFFQDKKNVHALKTLANEAMHEKFPMAKGEKDADKGFLKPDHENSLWDLDALFPHVKGIWLEIGFGCGDQLAYLMDNNPDYGFIGCEVFLNGIYHMAKKFSYDWPSQFRLHPEAIQKLLPRLPHESLDGIFIFFPDPWPKKAHHKRRLIQQEFLKECHRVLKPQGQLYLASDHKNYIQWIDDVFSECSFFTLKQSETCRQKMLWPFVGMETLQTLYEKKALAGRLGDQQAQCKYMFFEKN
jgi:tRNA (guanine-N(7)-)-methyltransferase